MGLQFDLFPTVNFQTEGYTRFGDDIASDNYFHTFTALDTLTMIRGNHTLKFGGEIQRHRDNYRNYGNGAVRSTSPARRLGFPEPPIPAMPSRVFCLAK
jgi:hypothetical protein